MIIDVKNTANCVIAENEVVFVLANERINSIPECVPISHITGEIPVEGDCYFFQVDADAQVFEVRVKQDSAENNVVGQYESVDRVSNSPTVPVDLPCRFKYFTVAPDAEIANKHFNDDGTTFVVKLIPWLQVDKEEYGDYFWAHRKRKIREDLQPRCYNDGDVWVLETFPRSTYPIQAKCLPCYESKKEVRHDLAREIMLSGFTKKKRGIF